MVTKKRRILIIDDDREILETLSDILEAKGYFVAIAQNEIDAIDKAMKEPFDVAIIDIVMPKVNGVQILRELKRITPGLKAIMMTGYAIPDLIERAVEEGAIEVLHKPLNMERLLRLIASRKEGGSPSSSLLLLVRWGGSGGTGV
jgi:DNA-binding NtrC family response regulator